MNIFPTINNFMTKSLITKIFIPLTTKDKKERTMLVKKTDGAILKCNIHFFSKVAVVMGNTVIKYWINGHYKCVTFELTTTKTSAVPSSTTTEIIL